MRCEDSEALIMKRILAMALALMIVLGGLCAAPKQALAASNGTIETVVRYEAQADGLVVGNDTLNIPSQGGGSMAVYLTGENGLTKEQAESVTAEATNGAAASVEAVEIGTDVYAAAVEIDTEGVELRSEFSVTMSGAEGAIQHTLNCTYGMVKETVYYEDINSYEGYREVDSAQVTEVTAYFRGKDETGLEDGNWTVLPFNVPRSTEYTTEIVDYQDEKKQICIEIKNTADADEMSFNTFAFVGPDGVLQATFMLAFKPGVDSGESGGNDEDDEDGNEGGAQICGVLIEGAEDRGFDINGFFTPENPKLTAYWRGLDGAEGGFASEAEAKQYSVEIDSKSSESVDTDIVTSCEKIENSDLYQLKIEIEIQNATSSTWIDYKICKSGVMVDGFGLSVLDGDEGNEGGNDQDQSEGEEEPILPAIPVIGQPLSGKTAEVILDGRRSYSVLFGVEEVFIYYRGEENTGMTLDEVNKLTAEIVRMESLSPKATLQCDVMPMAGEENLYQLKMTMELSNVAYYSWFEISVYDDDRDLYV